MGKNNENIKANEIEQHLKTNFDDIYQVFLQNMISSIPAPFGPFFSAIFSTVICPAPITEKISQLLIQFGNDIEKLQEKGLIDIEELMNDPIFTSELLYAIQIAMRNTQKEYHKALRHALLNSALNNPPEEDMRKMFFNFIDSFTITHFKLMKFFNKPKNKEWIDELSSKVQYSSYLDSNYVPNGKRTSTDLNFDLKDVFVFEFAEANEFEDLYLQITADLGTRGLILPVPLSSEIIGFNIIDDGKTSEPHLTNLGKLFMGFITSPIY